MYGIDSTISEIIRCIFKLLSDYYPTDKQALVVNLRPSCSVAKSDPLVQFATYVPLLSHIPSS